MDEVTKHITHDQADEACDRIEFVACAIAQMGGVGSYSDSVVAGCMSVLLESVDLLREYSNQLRNAEPAPKSEGGRIVVDNVA